MWKLRVDGRVFHSGLPHKVMYNAVPSKVCKKIIMRDPQKGFYKRACKGRSQNYPPSINLKWSLLLILPVFYQIMPWISRILKLHVQDVYTCMITACEAINLDHGTFA